MTREEQITHKSGTIADGCIAHGAPWKDYYQGFIDGAKWADANPSQPSLPSDLDEAAEEVRSRVKEIFDSLPKYDIDEERHNRVEFSLNALEAFALLFYQAGAEWMAGQGVKIGETKIYLEDDGDEPPYSQEWLDLESTEFKIPDGTFQSGDEVEVILRKKQ